MVKNQAVTAFLDYYVNLEAPEYAVMLKGEWGSGKTWFIKNYLRSKYAEESEKELYVYQSLYGIASIAELEDSLFAQMNPLWSSKLGRISGRIFSIATKTVTSSYGVTGDLSLTDFVNKLKKLVGRLLIFDDIERCKIPLTELLGYINQFVEHDGYRVILLANEEEIQKQDRAYANTREKLIGRTFDIETDVNAAVTSFFTSIKTPAIKAIFEKNQILITKIHEQSGYQNLRVLKHSLHDFERICQRVCEEALNCDPLMAEFLQPFLCFSLEIKIGYIAPAEIQAVMSSPMAAVMSSFGVTTELTFEEKKYQEIAIKYKNATGYFNALVPADIFQEIFHTGFAPEDKLNEVFANSKYFINENRPNWVNLWHNNELTDSEYERLLPLVHAEWGQKHYTDPTVVLHVAGILMRGGRFLEPKLTKKQVLKQAKSHIAELRKLSLIRGIAVGSQPMLLYETGSHGLGYTSYDEPEFKELLKYLISTHESILVASYPEIATHLLTALTSTDPDAFRMLLCESSDQNINLRNFEILNYVNKQTFFDLFLAASPIAQTRVFWAFYRRYEFLNTASPLLKERAWLAAFNTKLSSVIKRRKKLNSGTRFASLQTHYLNPIMEKFNKFKAEASQQPADRL